MTSEEYYDLVKAYEEKHRQSPTRYKLKLYLIALGGYVFVVGALLVNAALVAALLWLHLKQGLNGWIIAGYVIVGLTLWATIRSLFFRIPFPNGIALDRKHYPFIYERVKALRKPLKLGFKKIRVQIDWDFNASAASRPLFGFFGPSTYFVTIGLPLLNVLNKPQLDAVLAHELAHFSRKHTSSSIWLARVRITWIDLLHRLRTMRMTSLPFIWFAKWFSKYFEAASVVLMRENEYEADHLAASATSAKSCAEVMLRVDMRSEMVAEHWEKIWRKPILTKTVEQSAVSRLIKVLNEPLKREEMLQSLRWGLGKDTHFFDSHPSLADRLNAIGIELPKDESDLQEFAEKFSVPNAASTITAVLGQDQDEAEVFMDALWELINAVPWAIRNAEGAPLLEMDAILDRERRKKGTLSPDRLWKQAWLKSEIYGSAQAIPLIHRLLEQSPDHPHANFFHGARLLEDYDAEGIIYLEKAIELDPLSHQQAGLQVLSDFYRRMGANDDSEESLRESFVAGDETQKALKERAKKVSIRDKFETHQMDEKQLEDLRVTFEAVPEIKCVYLVTKTVKYMAATPYHIIGIVPTFAGLFQSQTRNVGLLTNIAISSSHQIVMLTPLRMLLRLAMSRVENSLAYRCEKWLVRGKKKRAAAKVEKAELRSQKKRKATGSA